MIELFNKMTMEQLIFLYEFFEDLGKVEGKLAHAATDEPEKKWHEQWGQVSFDMWMVLGPYLTDRVNATDNDNPEVEQYLEWIKKRAKE